MERHPELICEILAQIAARSTNTDDPALVDANIWDFTRHEVYGHVLICQRAGFLRTQERTDFPRRDVIVGLTCKGYDQLDGLRHELLT